MTNQIIKSTSDICKALKKDPILSLLVPSWTCRTIPIPVLEHGVPSLLFFFYLVKGEAGKSKDIFPPSLKVLINVCDSKILFFETAPLFWCPDHSPEIPIGKYPGNGLIGLSLDQTNEAYQQHNLLCDRILEAMAKNERVDDAFIAEWMNSFNQLKEDGYSKYFAPFVEQLNQLRINPKEKSQQLDESKHLNSKSLSNNPISQKNSSSVELVDVDDFLRKCKQFLVDSHLNTLLPLWKDIAVHQSNTSFSIAVIGEFSRGKSTLINRLLEEDLMPIGDLPTTSILSRIKTGIRRHACYIKSDKTQVNIPTTKEAFSAFVASASGRDPEGVLQIELQNQWLADTELILYDTPGTGDIIGKRATLTVEAITRCDAAIFVVNATMPCSYTEMEFIHTHIIAKKLPRIAVVISKLDLVKACERKSVIEYVCNRMHEVSQDIEVWAIHSREELSELADSITVAGPADIRNRIAIWINHVDTKKLRDIQTVKNLQELIKNAITIINDQLAIAKEQEDVRVKAISIAKSALAKSALGWDDIQIELNAKAFETEHWLEELLIEDQKELTTDLTYRLSQTNNPKQWWKRDFPFQVNQSMKKFVGKAEQGLVQRVASHKEWLAQSVKTKFSIEQLKHQIVANPETKFTIESSWGDNSVDFERTRVWSRIGLLAGTALSYMTLAPLLGPPVIIGVTGALTIWSETRLKNMLEQKKFDSKNELADAIDMIFRQVGNELREKLNNWYQEMFETIKERSSRWVEAEVCAIKKGSVMPTDDIEQLQNLVREAENLI